MKNGKKRKNNVILRRFEQKICINLANNQM